MNDSRHRSLPAVGGATHMPPHPMSRQAILQLLARSPGRNFSKSAFICRALPLLVVIIATTALLLGNDFTIQEHHDTVDEVGWNQTVPLKRREVTVVRMNDLVEHCRRTTESDIDRVRRQLPEETFQVAGPMCFGASRNYQGPTRVGEGHLLAAWPPEPGGGNNTLLQSINGSLFMRWAVRRGFVFVEDMSHWKEGTDAINVSVVSDETALVCSTVRNAYDVVNDVVLPLTHTMLHLSKGAEAIHWHPVLVTPLSAATSNNRNSATVPRFLDDLLQVFLRTLGRVRSGLDDDGISSNASSQLGSFASEASVLRSELADIERFRAPADAVRPLTTLPMPHAHRRKMNTSDWRCFCSSLWTRPLSLLSSSALGGKIIFGDAVRQRVSTVMKKSIVRELGFYPYLSEYNASSSTSIRRRRVLVPTTEVSRFGLWAPRPKGSVGLFDRFRRAIGWESDTVTAPRLLLLLRKDTRLLGNWNEVVAAATASGFNVAVIEPESMTAAQQAHAARYADVLVGVHGQGLTLLTLMDGISVPYCRRVIELKYYGRLLRGIHNVYEVLAADHKLRYMFLQPHFVTFQYDNLPQGAKKAKLVDRLMKRSFPHELPEFDHQTVYFDKAVLDAVFDFHFRDINRCLRGGSLNTFHAFEVNMSGVF